MEREMPLSRSSTFTVAPGMTAPAESVTTPRILPELVFCATAMRTGHIRARPRLPRIHCFILPPGVVPLLARNSRASFGCIGLRRMAGSPAHDSPNRGRKGPQIVSFHSVDLPERGPLCSNRPAQGQRFAFRTDLDGLR